MILAIGSIGPFRAGEVFLHPFGFFTASLEASPPSDFDFGTIQDIENLLLISQFGVFYNIGCSIWELSRLCMRICIELQLHKMNPEKHLISVEEEQRRRRVFWETYCLDRFSSSTLGRPFAIDDSIITVELAEPLLIMGQDPLSHDPSMASYGWPSYVEASDRRVFNHLLALSRITSGLHCSQQSQRSRGRDRETPNKLRSVGSGAEESYQVLHKLRGDLEVWRLNAPGCDSQVCLYQSPEYFELCFQKEKLYLIRVAIDKSPLKSSLPPKYLLRPCLSTAHNVVRTFNNLRLRGLVTYTRAYTHLIFTTSLIIVFLSFAQVHPQYQTQNADAHYTSGVDVESWWAGLLDEGRLPTQEECLEVLSMAGDVLNWLATNMPDMRPYANFLDVLRRELSKEINKARGQAMNRNGDSVRGTPVLGRLPEIHPHQSNTFGDLLSYSIPELPVQTQTDDDMSGGIGMGIPLDTQGVSPEGILFNFFPVADFLHDNGTVQPMSASWPFSQMPWIESINADLSGYDGDLGVP